MISLLNLREHVVLAPYTTYQIGGPADYFVIVSDKHELARAVITARKNNIPYFILGTGANILFGDKGFRGLVIKNQADNVAIKGDQLIVESGAIIADLIELTAQNNLSGLEHFAGIPSTVGGAIWQNLHFLAPDRLNTLFIESILESAELLDEENNIQTVTKDFFKFGYDYSILHDRNLLITEVTFKLSTKPQSEIRNQAQENLNWRNEKQPSVIEFPSCGSVFKKIADIGAGRLIDQVGLKGFRIGGAEISNHHANFIVNTGNATAGDVIAVIKKVQETVKEQTGYDLETEISFIGEF
jgi:UDP-N-acetylmuramate dehydrogenase